MKAWKEILSQINYLLIIFRSEILQKSNPNIVDIHCGVHDTRRCDAEPQTVIYCTVFNYINALQILWICSFSVQHSVHTYSININYCNNINRVYYSYSSHYSTHTGHYNEQTFIFKVISLLRNYLENYKRKKSKPHHTTIHKTQ